LRSPGISFPKSFSLGRERLKVRHETPSANDGIIVNPAKIGDGKQELSRLTPNEHEFAAMSCFWRQVAARAPQGGGFSLPCERSGGNREATLEADTKRRNSMKRLVPVVATLLVASVPLAYAADATGKITAIDMTKDMVTLDNGSTFVAPSTVKLSSFKVGEKVSVNYMTNAGKNEIKIMKPAA
jgi:hypothetical protein